MEETYTGSYIIQAIGIILIYIACMFIFINFNPDSSTMNCDENYYCKVENRYVWTFKRTGDFYVNKNAKLRFYGTNSSKSGFVNIYGEHLNTDPFGTKNFYSFKSENPMQRETIMNNDINRFDDYIKNPKLTFTMKKVYKNKLPCLGITAFFLCFAITKRPLENLLKLIGFIIRIIFFRGY